MMIFLYVFFNQEITNKNQTDRKTLPFIQEQFLSTISDVRLKKEKNLSETVNKHPDAIGSRRNIC